jgi:HK97 family phage major capsid protein
VITTSTGEAMNIPTVDETNVVGAILAENTQMAEQDVAIGQKSIGSFMWTSKLVRASLQFVEDAAIDVESWLRGILAARIGRAQNAKFTNGAGTTEPLGIVTGRDTAKDVTSTGATAGTVAYVDLVNAVGKIDPAYRAMPGMAWMLHDAVVGNFRKILDSSGRPIWSPSTSGLTGGAEDRLLGYPIIVNQDLDATPTTAADVIALVGNFKESYLVRDTNDLRVLVLSERYADYLQRGYTAFQRSDGTVINTAAYAAIIE